MKSTLIRVATLAAMLGFLVALAPVAQADPPPAPNPPKECDGYCS